MVALKRPILDRSARPHSRVGRGEEMRLHRSNIEIGRPCKCEAGGPLDNKSPIQGFQMPADRDEAAHTGAGVGKPPGKEPAREGR